jgi:hypothetical protein
MTPKQKAIDLFSSFRYALSYKDAPLGMYKDNIAIQCALIAVDEVISANPHSNPFNTDVYSTMDYWQEVKKEIENFK